MQSFLESDDETNVDDANEVDVNSDEEEQNVEEKPNTGNDDEEDDDDDDDEDYNFSLQDIDWDSMAKSMGDTVEVIPSDDKKVPPLLLKKLRLVCNEPLLQQKLQDLQTKSNGLPWYETLTVSTKPTTTTAENSTAALNANSSAKKNTSNNKRQKQKQKQNEDSNGSKLKNNDIKREIYFYEHTLEAVKEAVDRIRLEIPNGERLIQRPNDFYAEMIKSDDHMKKIKGRILWEQKKIGIVENRKKNKRLKKYHKEMMSQKMKDDAQGRKDQNTAIEEWKHDQRRGDQTLQDIMKNARSDYLNKMKAKGKHKPNMHRIMKNLKYGNGGVQRGLKGKNKNRNTHNSTNNYVPDWNRGQQALRSSERGGQGGQKRFQGKGNAQQYNKNVKRQRGILGKNHKQAPSKRQGKDARKRTNQRNFSK